MHPLIVEQVAAARIADRRLRERGRPVRAAAPGAARVLVGRILVAASDRLARTAQRVAGEVATARSVVGRP